MINPHIFLGGRAMGILILILIVGLIYIIGTHFGEKVLAVFLWTLFGVIVIFFTYWIIKLIRLWFK